MGIVFSSVVLQAEGMTATGIPVPDDAVAELGSGKNPPVNVTLRKSGTTKAPYRYRTSIATRDGRYIMSFSAANRQASGLVAGDAVEVEIELDTVPRTVVIPDDLAAALTAAGGLEAFTSLSYSKQRGHVDVIEGAKTQETRQRRVDKVVAEFSG